MKSFILHIGTELLILLNYILDESQSVNASVGTTCSNEYLRNFNLSRFRCLQQSISDTWSNEICLLFTPKIIGMFVKSNNESKL